MQKYETERAQKATLIPELERRVREQLETKQDASLWADAIQQYTEITKLDENILFELVERIEVGETVRRGPLRVRNVKVVYRYVGNVDDAVSEEMEAQHDEAV